MAVTTGEDKPARPLRADARRNRARVLAAAEEAFAVEGIAVPLDDIARRAGVGAGTVYRHFPSKEALFEAVIHDRARQLVDDVRALATSQDPGAAFFSFLSEMVASGRAKKDLVDALVDAGVQAGAGASIKRDLAAAGETLLVRAQEAGAVRYDVTILDLMTLLEGTIAAIQRRDDAGPGLADRMFDVLRVGLEPR